MRDDVNQRKRARFNESGEALNTIKNILSSFSSLDIYVPFEKPVDPIVERIPQYPDVVKNPMDLGTIQNKIKRNLYNNNVDECVADIALVFDNCFLFNHPDSDVARFCLELQNKIAKKMEEYPGLFSAEQIDTLREPTREKHHSKMMGSKLKSRRRPSSSSSSAHPAPGVVSSLSSSLASSPSSPIGYQGVVTAERDRVNAFSAGQLQRIYYQQQQQRWMEQGGEGEFGGMSHVREIFPLQVPNLDELLPRFEGDEIPLTDMEKDELFEIILCLPPAYMNNLVDVLRKIAPQNADEVAVDIVEFDIDRFDVRVQRHILRYLVNCRERLGLEKTEAEQEGVEKVREGGGVEQKEEEDGGRIDVKTVGNGDVHGKDG